MKKEVAADRRAREAAQSVFDRPVMLEAGAGTGKTTTLVARALAWCLGPGWDEASAHFEADEPHKTASEVLQGVVAITFTEAAAAEMAARVAESLAMVVDGRESEIKGFTPQAGDDETIPTRRWRAARLLETFDHLTVSTIHAFCYGLLTDFPLEAGLHPDLRVDADGSELEVVARGAVERWTQQAYRAAEDSPFLELASHGIGPGQLLDAVTRWLSIGAPLELLEVDPLSPEKIADHLARLSAGVAHLTELIGDRLATLPSGRLASQVAAALEVTQMLLAGYSDPTTEDLASVSIALKQFWQSNLTSRLGKWSRSDFTAEEADKLEDLGESLAKASSALRELLRITSRLDPALLAAARRALLPVVRQIEQELRSRGVITFSGLLRETQNLLRRSPSVLDRIRKRTRLLLVDEFQDTDPVQTEIVRRLALEGDPADCPSLFVVGDPKQSIYGWRDADLAAYEAFENLLLERGGERYALSINFRSAQEILDEVESTVSPVMRAEPGLQPAFHGLRAAPRSRIQKPFRQGNWREIEYWVSWRPSPDAGLLGPGTHGESRQVEARELANDVRKLHEQAGVPWNDIAVLFRKTMSQPTFLDELRRQGIPFAVNRDRNYYQRREVIEAAAWIRTILNPADHLALLTVLRSVTVGVPDAALIPLWAHAFPKMVTELTGPNSQRLEELRKVVRKAAGLLPQGVPGLDRVEGWEESLLAALASLARLRRAYHVQPPDLFVDQVRRELLVEASEAARFQGKFRLANLQRFFSQLETAMESDEADVHSILRALRLGVQQAREAEEAVPRDAVEEAVQVMTIHTAKGLEFPHVYLVQLHSGTRGGGNELLEAREIEPDDWEYQLFGASTLSYHRAEEKIQRIESAEAVRTLYVALTRASQRLVLVGRWPELPRPVARDRAGNYIDLLQSRKGLPDSLTSLANDPAIQLQGFHDVDGIRWRFLGGAQSLGAWRPRDEAADWLPDAERLERIEARQATQREAAVERSSRPLQASVTGGVSDRIEQSAIEFREETGEPGTPSRDRRDAAMAVGSALHRCLETWNLGRPIEEELEEQRDRLPSYFPEPPVPQMIAETERRLSVLAGSKLLARLVALSGDIVGREVPIVATPDSSADAPLEHSPVGALVGSIDLLYRDPDSSRLVVADFKTDRVENEEAVEQRAAAYALQEARYARAVKEAFDLDYTPRTELWLLWQDRIWTAREERS